MSKRIETTVTAGRNGGIHDTRSYKKACQWLDGHTFTNGQLWHVVFKGSASREDYTYALDTLCEQLRDAGMAVEWRAAYEVDDKKGLHRHVFLLIEAELHKPHAIIQWNDHTPTPFMRLMAKRGISFYIAAPEGVIHRTAEGKQQKYAYVPKKAGPKLDDCKNWLSYIYKVRSKEGVVGEIYSSSRKRTRKAVA